LRKEQLRAAIADTHSDAAIAGARPYPGAVETVNTWHDAGNFIHITSHRDPCSCPATARWLHDIGLHYDDLNCSFDKVARAVELEIELLIDDSPVNLTDALEAGMHVATIAHPWNREICEDEDDIVCAPDWPALAAALERRCSLPARAG